MVWTRMVTEKTEIDRFNIYTADLDICGEGKESIKIETQIYSHLPMMQTVWKGQSFSVCLFWRRDPEIQLGTCHRSNVQEAIRHTNLDLRGEHVWTGDKRFHRHIHNIYNHRANGTPWNGVERGKDPQASNIQKSDRKRTARTGK